MNTGILPDGAVLGEFSALPPLWGLIGAAVWGLLWGSFLNVVIHRVPRGLSVVRPGSHCPGCGHPVRAWDNVPVFSWLLLRGRCRDCRWPIPARYPLVEALTGLLSLALYARFVVQGPDAPWVANLAAYLVFFAFAAALVAVIFIDLDHQIIPDGITYGGMLAGLLVSFLLPDVAPWESLLGLVAGGAAIRLLILVYSWLRGIQGMGLGDLKLLAMIGAWLGYRSLLFVLLVGSLLGLGAAAALGLRRRLTGQSEHLYDPALLQEDAADEPATDDEPPSPELPGQPPPPAAPAPAALPLHRTAIAFGPYLATAAILYLLAGEQLSAWYFDLLGRVAGTLLGG